MCLTPLLFDTPGAQQPTPPPFLLITQQYHTHQLTTALAPFRGEEGEEVQGGEE